MNRNAEEAEALARKIHSELTGGEGTQNPPVVTSGAENNGIEGGSPTATEAQINELQLVKAEADQYRKELEALQHKHQVLQGKYNAEVPRLHEEAKALRKQVGDFMSEKHTITLNAALDTVRTELGESVADAIKQMIPGAGAAAGGAQAPQTEEPAPASETVDGDGATGPLDRVRGMVDSVLNRPGIFDKVNNDPVFIAFLENEKHPQTQIPMGEHLTERFNAGDLPEVSRIFLSFVQKSAQQSAKAAEEKRLRDAAPNVASGASTNGQGQEPARYSRKEYEETMHALMHDPKYKTAEGIVLASRMRNELLEALRDGRIG